MKKSITADTYEKHQRWVLINCFSSWVVAVASIIVLNSISTRDERAVPSGMITLICIFRFIPGNVLALALIIVTIAFCLVHFVECLTGESNTDGPI